MGESQIKFRFLSQEDLVEAGAFDIPMAIGALKEGLFKIRDGRILFPDKIVCDDWETVKHRTQTVSRCYKEGLISDGDIYANLIDILSGQKPGRESEDEFIYFNAVGLAYADISIAHAMYQKALAANIGTDLPLQGSMIFEKNLAGK